MATLLLCMPLPLPLLLHLLLLLLLLLLVLLLLLLLSLLLLLPHVTDGDSILLGRHGMPGKDACNCDGGSRPRMRRPPFRNEEKITEGEYCTT